MKKKNKIYLAIIVLFFLGAFFGKINNVTAATCGSFFGTCKYACDSNTEDNIGTTDCTASQTCCTVRSIITAATCANENPGFSCVDSTGKTGCVVGRCLGGSNIQCCPSSTASNTTNSTSNSFAAATTCGTNFEKVGGVCFPTNTGLSSASVSSILSNIFSWLMGLFTLFAVGAFVISGIQYLTSAGNEEQAETAKKNATYAMLGIVVGLSGFVIVKAIAAALSGSSTIF